MPIKQDSVEHSARCPPSGFYGNMTGKESVFKSGERCLKTVSNPQNQFRISWTTRSGAMTPMLGALLFLVLAHTAPSSGQGGSWVHTTECIKKHKASCRHYGKSYINGCYERTKFWPESDIPKVGLCTHRLYAFRNQLITFSANWCVNSR